MREHHAATEALKKGDAADDPAGGLDLSQAPSPPPAWGVNVDVALGKTRAFREIVAAELVGERSVGHAGGARA